MSDNVIEDRITRLIDEAWATFYDYANVNDRDQYQDLVLKMVKILNNESKNIVHCYFCGKEIKVDTQLNDSTGRWFCSECYTEYYESM